MCQHTDPGMTLKHRDFDPFGSGRSVEELSEGGVERLVQQGPNHDKKSVQPVRGGERNDLPTAHDSI